MTKALYALVGMKHRGTEAFVAGLAAGEPLVLIREPLNPYDRNAVQVWARGVHAGYVKATQARQLAMAMDAKPPSVPVTVGRLSIDDGRWPLVEVEA